MEFRNLPEMKFNIETNIYAIKTSIQKPEVKFNKSLLVAEREEGFNF